MTSSSPPCSECNRAVPLRGRGPRGRICGACAARARRTECSLCGRFQPPRRRDSEGRPICATCVDQHIARARIEAMRVDIAAVVAQVEPELDEAAITTAVARVTPNLRYTGWLADALAAGPQAMLGGSVAPPVVDRLVAELRAAGATTVQPATCFACGTTRWLDQRVDGLRACTGCAAKARAEICGRCGKQAPVATREPNGAPVCTECLQKDPARFEMCARCGRHRHVAYRNDDGTPLCGGCGRRRPIVACSVCGETRRATSSGRYGPPKCSSCSRRRARCTLCGGDDRIVAMVLASGPVCSTCHKKVLSAKGTCSGCGQRRRIDPRDPRQLGLCSDCAGLDPWSVCLGCGLEDRIYDAGRCLSCTLEYRLTELVGDSAILDPLRTALLGTDQPRAALRWLSKPPVAEVLRRIAQGDLPATHEALDDLGDGRQLAHLRQVLVAGKVLPERDEQTARLETWIQKQLVAITVDEDRRVVEAFANWWVLRRYRWRMSKNGVASHQHARKLVLGAVSFLGWVREHSLTLGTCSQAHVELWLAGPPARRHARDFLRWACRRGLAHDLDIVRQPDPIPGRSGDTEWHRSLARRFATDESLPLGDRVAGLLLLCYAQPLARLSRLKTTDVTVDTAHTSIQFGRTDVELSEPVGRLVRELVACRRGRAATGAPDHTPWLFPGGRPARPIGPQALGERLAGYGVDARVARTSLLLDLAAELSPVVLADLLGMQQRTAVRWVRSASGDWSGYAAARNTSRL